VSADEGQKLDALVAEAEELQAELLRGVSN